MTDTMSFRRDEGCSDVDWEEWDRETEQKFHGKLYAASSEDLAEDGGYIVDIMMFCHGF